MNLTVRLQTLKTVQARIARLESITLASLPKEYGFRSMEAFIAAIRHATRVPQQPSRRTRWVRRGGTFQFRREVAELLAQRESAIEIALKLGVSLRVVDRAMAKLESAQSDLPGKKRRQGGANK